MLAYRPWTIAACLAALFAAAGCAGDDPLAVQQNPGNGGGGGGGGGSFTVVSTSPSATATDVSLTSPVRVTFSQAVDPSTVSAAVFSVNNGVTGTINVSGATVELVPAAPLTGSTQYSATIGTAVRSMTGVALASPHTWSFRTITIAPSANFPLTVGKRWRYVRNDTTTIVAASTGVTTARFTGEQFAYVAEQTTIGGRSAARLVVLGYNSTPMSSKPQFTASEEYLSQTASGLDRWIGSSTGGQWKPLLSNTSSSLTNATFLFTQGPSQGNDIQLSASSTTVPAGSYTTVRARHSSSNWQQYATQHWDEARTEDYANNVGLVRSQWNYYFDPTDPAAADISQHGSIQLTHVDAGPIPVFGGESESNDSSNTADVLTPSRSVIEGMTHIAHTGATLTSAGVGCGITACLTANENGQIRMQDWYRLDVTAATTVRIELQYTAFDAASGQFNDLDLYAFQVTSGALRFLAVSGEASGEAELLTGTLNPGTYYFAVQAWKTRGSNVRYWLSVR